MQTAPTVVNYCFVYYVFAGTEVEYWDFHLTGKGCILNLATVSNFEQITKPWYIWINLSSYSEQDGK